MHSEGMPDELDLEGDALKRAQSGDKEAFRVLVELHYEKVFAMELRQVRDRSVAEELTQEIFVKAYKNIHSFRHQAKFSTWLTRIAFNHTSSYFKSRRFKESRRTVSLIEENVASSQDSQTEELISRLNFFITKLAPHHREVLVLCAMEGRTYEEAAKVLEIPIGTIRSRMNTAIKNLKRNFWNS